MRKITKGLKVKMGERVGRSSPWGNYIGKVFVVKVIGGSSTTLFDLKGEREAVVTNTEFWNYFHSLDGIQLEFDFEST